MSSPPLPITAQFMERVLDLTVAVQQIPAPTFAEQDRAAFIKQYFVEAGLVDIEIDAVSNVYARRPGGKGQPIMVSAHLDTVFEATTNLTVSREPGRIAGPGIGDNSIAVASLIGLAWLLNEQQVELPGDLWLVANVGEEGLGDLNGMKAVVNRFEDEISAYIVLEGNGVGRLVNQGVGSRRYKITALAPGGHSWADFGQASAIHALVQLATHLTTLQVATRPKTTFNIGVIEGGTSVNTIAERANLQLDLRSESAEALQTLVDQVETLVEEFEAGEAMITLDIIGDRPAGYLVVDHPLMQLSQRVLREVGVDEIAIKPSSTDANIPLARGYPAVCIGLTKGGNVHRLSEYIETAPFTQGFEQLVRLTIEASKLVNDR